MKTADYQDYRQAIAALTGADATALEAARKHCDFLLKPLGALGELEEIAVKLAGITGQTLNRLDKRVVVVMAADNGVYAEGVAAAPQEFTRSQAISMTRGICGVSVFSREAGAELKVVDIGIKDPTGCPDVLDKNVRRGTANMAKGPAMSLAEVEQAINVGFELACDLYDQGFEILATGEMGIANTTSSSACLIALSDVAPEVAVGRGAGLTDEQLAHKIEVVKQALAVNQPDANDPLDVLAKVGGLDIAGMVGCFIAAAACRRPILIDGVISAIASLVAIRLAPAVRDFCFATHRSLEPAYDLIAAETGLIPFLNLGMRLGEGSGAALAFSVFSAACAMMADMGSFADVSFDESVLVDNR
jgi:nicotinate-nucleotide--dimethylbenzimidazole phosphoribosyltransferase